jgi:hypothetical protein
VVLAKKYTFEAKRLVTHPEIEVTPEQCSYSAAFGSVLGLPSSGKNSNSQGLIIGSPLSPQIAAHEREIKTGTSRPDLTPARETLRQMFARLEMAKAGARRAGRH